MTAESSVQDKVYKGACFCGAVEFTVSGDPAAAGYCHCGSCRTWSAGPPAAHAMRCHAGLVRRSPSGPEAAARTARARTRAGSGRSARPIRVSLI